MCIHDLTALCQGHDPRRAITLTCLLKGKAAKMAPVPQAPIVAQAGQDHRPAIRIGEMIIGV